MSLPLSSIGCHSRRPPALARRRSLTSERFSAFCIGVATTSRIWLPSFQERHIGDWPIYRPGFRGMMFAAPSMRSARRRRSTFAIELSCCCSPPQAFATASYALFSSGISTGELARFLSGAPRASVTEWLRSSRRPAPRSPTTSYGLDRRSIVSICSCPSRRPWDHSVRVVCFEDRAEEIAAWWDRARSRRRRTSPAPQSSHPARGATKADQRGRRSSRAPEHQHNGAVREGRGLAAR